MKFLTEFLIETRKVGISDEYAIGYLDGKELDCLDEYNVMTDEDFVQCYNYLLMTKADEEIKEKMLKNFKSSIVLDIQEIEILKDVVNCMMQCVEDRTVEINKEFFKFLEEKLNMLIDLEYKLSDSLNCLMVAKDSYLEFM